LTIWGKALLRCGANAEEAEVGVEPNEEEEEEEGEEEKKPSTEI
jgi:hypothetical protein